MSWIYSDEDPKKSVRQVWNNTCSTCPPLSRIRAYYGEKVAFYFDFLATYTGFLFLLAPFGIGVQVCSYLYDSQNIVSMLANAGYCVVTAL